MSVILLICFNRFYNCSRERVPLAPEYTCEKLQQSWILFSYGFLFVLTLKSFNLKCPLCNDISASVCLCDNNCRTMWDTDIQSATFGSSAECKLLSPRFLRVVLLDSIWRIFVNYNSQLKSFKAYDSDKIKLRLDFDLIWQSCIPLLPFFVFFCFIREIVIYNNMQ